MAHGEHSVFHIYSQLVALLYLTQSMSHAHDNRVMQARHQARPSVGRIKQQLGVTAFSPLGRLSALTRTRAARPHKNHIAVNQYNNQDYSHFALPKTMSSSTLSLSLGPQG